MGFIEVIKRASVKSNSLVCVGLDTDPAKLPGHLVPEDNSVLNFNKAIIRATSDLVCAYKPNSAFYEALGSLGIETLKETCKAVPPDIPVILDIKRGDIGASASHYATYAYDIIGADAVTVNPYMGFDAVKPFLREDKCVFVLCLTSNPSAKDFQLLDQGSAKMYERIAEAALKWSEEGEIGLVVGATHPENMMRIREIIGDMPVLVPGVGAQGGDVESVIKECGGVSGSTIVNSSRAILYASDGHDFSNAARESLLALRNEINSYRDLKE